MPCVNAAGEIVSYTIPWLQDAIDREKGLAKSKAARTRWRAPAYELVHRVPKPDVLADEWRWSIKIIHGNGKVEWIDDYYEKADAEKEIIRLRDRRDAYRHKERERFARDSESFGHRDSSYHDERNGMIDSQYDAEWN